MENKVLEDQALVIAAPSQCYLPSHPRRSWGVSVQLYGLQFKNNWGLGDFDNLEQVVKWAGKTLQGWDGRSESASFSHTRDYESLFSREPVVSQCPVLKH